MEIFLRVFANRSHLREIRDRSVLRLFESADVSGGLPMAGIGIAGGVGHFEDPSYFSEPEFDSEYQHQHIHKSKVSRYFSYEFRIMLINFWGWKDANVCIRGEGLSSCMLNF